MNSSEKLFTKLAVRTHNSAILGRLYAKLTPGKTEARVNKSLQEVRKYHYGAEAKKDAGQKITGVKVVTPKSTPKKTKVSSRLFKHIKKNPATALGIGAGAYLAKRLYDQTKHSDKDQPWEN